jgi:protein-tyrosine phosphatase
MDPLVEQLRQLLSEQTEPYQRKMKAKHSRLKKRVIGHGGQKAGPPYSEKPSMERSKSAPPIGETTKNDELIIVERIVKKGKQYCLKSKKSNKNLGCYSSKADVEQREREVQTFKHMNEGFFNFFKKKEQKPQESEPVETPDEYTEAPQSAKGYTFLTDNLAVGAAPMKYGILSKNALSIFDKIYIMSDQVAELLMSKDRSTLEANKQKVILMPVADIDQPIDDIEAEKLIEHDKEIINAINTVDADLKAGKKILVTCSMGLNRSATVAAGALVKGGLDPEDAIQLIKSRRGEKALSLNSKPHQRFINTIRSQKNLEESLRRVIRRLIREEYGRKRH